ncbi:uncharacterized protein M421DRAFT_424259 [Didymella exigua CBS 183.55]|uniref:Uncharacterized protein n=1 Tax=Didymella exigua CBS 183.55 TaxID=1150837 RepID=A0A6A5RCM6_9PLEO|nr:uncharacterized protein M421DRAFT_424259 [Didymella exigua CBS 183.55]KAF1925040.1 hypothetical protein M421DRAFT_424259 [Didymella exigua CBS 183.55]
MCIQVHFETAEISIQIPNHDWLMRRQGHEWHKKYSADWIKFRDAMQMQMKMEVVLLTLPLNARTQDQPGFDKYRGLALMQILAFEPGLKNDVLIQMMWSVYRVWALYRSDRADSIIEGEASDAGFTDAYNISINL